MIRGTTPTLTFKLPFDTELLAEVWVTLSQVGKIVLNKDLKQLQRTGDTLTLTLTQEETLKLTHGVATEIQVRARTIDGNALASQIIAVPTEEILKDGVI